MFATNAVDTGHDLHELLLGAIAHLGLLYMTFADMCSAISTYYRTARFKLDILKFANRKAALFCTNLTICGGHKVFRWYRL